MQPENFFKCSCLNCNGPIEFPRNGLGQSIVCPHCNTETVLTEPNQSRTAPTARRKVAGVWIAFAVLALVGAMAAGIFAARKQPQPVSAAETISVAQSDAAPPDKPRKKTVKTVRKNAGLVANWNGLKTGGVTLEKSGSRLIYAVGTVRNDSKLQRFGVKVDLDLLNAQGEKIGSTSDYTQFLEPNAEWRFKALVTDPETERAKIVAIHED